MENLLKIGIIGLGPRSPAQIHSTVWTGAATTSYICDLNEALIQKRLKIFEELELERPKTTTDYQVILDDPEINAVLVPSSWNSHVPIAIEAMRAGKPVAFEVGGAASIQQLWELVRTSEETGVPCMMLENCCYGRNELLVHNLVRQGYFGELIYCEGGYEHYLGGMVKGIGKGHERIMHNMFRNADLYPTHALGPISKILGINRGNRFVSLVSQATKSRRLAHDAVTMGGFKADEAPNFNKGDMVVTTLKCANGELVTLKHSVSLPRPYSRSCRVQGTKGIWLEDAKGIFIEGLSNDKDNGLVAAETGLETWDDIADYYETYDHPIWKKFRSDIKGGHGGMDTLVHQAFYDAVKRGVQPPIDVYDAATWMAVTPLSEDSIAMGGAPVPFPDFTNGKWINREPEPQSPWSIESKE